MMTRKRNVTRGQTRYNVFTRFMALLMVFALCMSNLTVTSAEGTGSESVESDSEGSFERWSDGTTTTFVWEDDEKTVTVEVSDAAALPNGAEFVVEDLTDEEFEASKQLIIDQTFRNDSEYGDTEEERVAYAQAVLSGLVLYDMHFVYEGTEYDVDSAQMKVTIANKIAVVTSEETVTTDDGSVYVIGDIEDSTVVAIHIEETDDGENVVEVTDDAAMDEDGAIESVELTVESFSTIGYYPLTEYQQIPITDDTLINDWGGSYTLYFILNNYNIFTSGNALAQHTVGAVAVGGTSSFTYGIGAGNYGTHPVPSYFEGGFVEGGFNSYIGGNALYFTGYDSNVYSWAYQSYDLRFNDGGTGTIDSSVTHNNGYFIDFTSAMSAIEAEMNTYVNDGNDITVDITNTDATLTNDHYAVTYNGSSITVTVESGYSYVFDDLDAIDYIDIKTGADANDENVNIISKESGKIVLPKIHVNGADPTGSETDYGCGLVFMLPNATTVDIGSKSNGTFLGHVVAPNAAVTSEASGNTNGSFICVSFSVPSMENHMWHYNGSLIQPDTHSLTAVKTLDGAAPTDADDEFSFTLSELNSSGVWEVKQTKTAAYTTGLVSFDSISYSSEGTHWYLVAEVEGDTSKYSFDTTLYLAKVVVTSTTTGTTNATTTYEATASYYKAADGTTASQLIQSSTTTDNGETTTTYTVDTSKLTALTLSSENAETSEIFTFGNTTTKGSLWITKNVTVNGAATKSTDADGTYTFYVKDTSGNTVKTVTITITNGVSNTVEVTDLPIGTYIVEEDISLNPTGMTLTGSNDISVTVTENGTASVSTAAFTNNLVKVGSLTIQKNVLINGESTTGTAADGTYTFQIYNANSELKDTVQITITNGRSNTVTVDNLEEGKYYILEVLSDNPYGMELVGDNSIVVEVTANNTTGIPVAEFTNNLTQTGSLKITKNVTVNGEPATLYDDPTVADGSYTFYIVQESTGITKADRTLIITNGVSTTTQVDNLEPGWYRVYEQLSGNPNGMSLTSGQGIRVYVYGDDKDDAGNTVINVAEFTNNKTEVGSLAITKSVTVNGNPASNYSDPTVADGTYTFYVVDENNNEVARTTAVIFNGVSSTVQIDNLEPGVYYVYEELSSLPSGMSLVSANGMEVTVTANNTANVPTVEFVNNTEKTGSLQITKNVTINGEDPSEAEDPTAADGTYTFYVINESGNEVARKTLTIDNGQSTTVQIDNLVPGVYYVYEYVTGNPAGVTLVTSNGVQVTVTADNTTTIPVAEFTNDVEDVGSLKITKNVTINGKDPSEAEDPTAADGTYTFYVVDENNNEVARRNITIVNGVSNTAQIDNLVPGIYYVYEYLGGNPDGVTLVTQNGVEVKVTADETVAIPTVEFTNDVEDVGSLIIRKNVTVNGKSTTGTSADGTYTFYVVDESNNEVARRNITIVNGQSNTAEIDNLIPGVYYVYEYLNSNPDGMALTSGNGVQVTVTADDTAAIPVAEFTNNKTEVGSLQITKNVTINGKDPSEAEDPTAADGTYTFYVVNESNVEVARRSITIENGVSKTETIGNLEPGVYHVYEYLAGNPSGVTLVTTNGVQVTVTANNTASISVAEFTNDVEDVGSLKITKNVTINGADSSKAEDPTAADGTYTFYVVDENNNEVARRNITIVNGESKTEQINNLVPGTYYVYEYVASNPSGVTLVTANGVEVKVSADDTAAIPVAEFTNDVEDVGSLIIQKNVTVNGKSTTGTEADGTYTFYVLDENGAEVARQNITIVNGESNTAQINNLVPGVYYVYENIDSNPNEMALTTANGVQVKVTADETAEIPVAKFTNNKTAVGSLQITKNVTVNGETTTGTAADGTYTFRVFNASNELKDTVKITITNGQSNTVQVDNLEEGKYYIVEVLSDNPSGMELVGDNSIVVDVKADNATSIPVAEFTNNLTQVGSLKITKNVTVNGDPATKYSDPKAADGAYTFYIVQESTGKTKADRTIIINNGVSTTEQVDNLEPGWYRVYEYLAGNPSGMSLTSEQGVRVYVYGDNTNEAGETVIGVAEFTNNKTEVGSLAITKSVTVNGNPASNYSDPTVADGTYTFYVVDENNNEVARTTAVIFNGVSSTVQINNLEPGIYYVYEELSSLPSGMSLVSANGVEVTVTANNTANVPTVEFVNNTEKTGSLQIKKNVTINGKNPSEAEDPTAADGIYTFYVVNESGNEVARKTLTIDNGQSTTVQIDNLVPGVYYVYEYVTGNPAGVTLVTSNGVQVTVTADNTTTIPVAEFTNDVEDAGSLKITKNVTINGMDVSKAEDPTAADGTYTFYVVDESNNEVARRNITIVNGESRTVQIDNLAPGIYYVYEYLAGNPDGVTLVTPNGVEVKVTANETAEIPTAEFTNDVEDVGSLIIKKNVTINGVSASEYSDPTAADGTYTFYVVDESNNEVARRNITIVNGVSNTAQIDNLVPGVYYVYEYLAGNPDGMALTSGNGVQVTVTADETAVIPVAEFTNNKTEVGSLKITKNVTINGMDVSLAEDPTAADGTYTFYVVDANNNEVARRNITIENGVSKTEQIDNLEPGVYYVYEYLATNPTGVTLVTANGVEVTVTADNTTSIPTAEFTNDVEDVGSLRITKHVTINGESPDDAADRTAADGTYTFYVVDESNNEVARRNITIVNGESKTEQIDNLVPGVYYVYEYLAGNPDGVTLTSGNGIMVVVTADETVEIPVAEFTNDVEDVGSLIIKKNVTINHMDPTDEDVEDPTAADGTYTFYVVDENNNEVARRNITIINGESNTAQIDNLKPGTYYVYEYLTSNPSGVTLVTPNGVEVTVKSGETSEIPVAEFTNDVEAVGSLKITKNVLINGLDPSTSEDPTAADGTYTFYVVNDENVVVARRNITIVNGESKTEEIDNLIPGTYYVYEYTDGLAGNVSLISENGIEITVTANETAEISVAEFTNNAVKLGRFKLTKNVLINGEDPADAEDPTEADGTYTFYVLDASGNEVARENLTIEHGESGSITFDNLIPGTYYVYEYTNELKEEITLISENGVEVIVSVAETEDGAVEVPTVTFTNNYAEKPYKEVDATSDSGVDGSSVAIGDVIIYNIDYHNHLNETVIVEVTDELDEGVNFVSASEGGTYDAKTHTVTWAIETEALASGTVWVEVQVNDTAAVKTHVTEFVEDENGNWIEIDVEDSDVTATIDNQARVIIVDHEYYTNLVTNEVDEPVEDDSEDTEEPKIPDTEDETDSTEEETEEESEVETESETDTEEEVETEEESEETTTTTKKTGDNDFTVMLSLLIAGLGVFLVAETRQRRKSN